jgi:hypothetical protein
MGDVTTEQVWMSPRIKAASGKNSFVFDKGIVKSFHRIDCRRMTATEYASVMAFVAAVDGISHAWDYTDSAGLAWKAWFWNADEIRSGLARHNRWQQQIHLILMNHVDYIDMRVKEILDPDKIRGFWIFDQTGATSTITDRSGRGHNITLRDGSLVPITASACSPGVTGFAPYLIFGTNKLWNTPDHDDFTASAGNKLSVLGMADIIPGNNRYLQKGAAGQYEWAIWFLPNTINVFMADPTFTNYIGRKFNTSLAGDPGTPHTYGFTYAGGIAASSIKVFRDGSRVDDTDFNGGTFTGMTNGSATVETGQAGVINPPTGKQYAVIISSEEWTAAQWDELDTLLRGYAGVL